MKVIKTSNQANNNNNRRLLTPGRQFSIFIRITAFSMWTRIQGSSPAPISKISISSFYLYSCLDFQNGSSCYGNIFSTKTANSLDAKFSKKFFPTLSSNLLDIYLVSIIIYWMESNCMMVILKLCRKICYKWAVIETFK